MAALVLKFFLHDTSIFEKYWFVGNSILITLFLITTIAGLFYYKNRKKLYNIHLFSIFIILIGIIVLFSERIDWVLQIILLLLLYLYIFALYGLIICARLWRK